MEDPSKKHASSHEPTPMPGEPEGFALPDVVHVPHEGLPTGTGLGKYRILERLYSTYNGVVYKARDMLLDRLVTIKQMNPALLDDPVACGLFKREAQFLARIPRGIRHIVSIHELIELDRGLFIVGEFVNGQWLESLIAKRHLDVMSVLRILRTAANGLRTLHGLSMVHRGIHPQSIMVTKSMRAMITNLGTSAHEGDTTPVPVLFAQYTAPEILAGRVYDNRVDIYSLGMTLYEYCVGRTAMHRILETSATDAISGARLWTDWQRDLKRELPDASELNSTIPVALSSILRRMTAKNLDDRYASCQQVLEKLDQHFKIRRGGSARPHMESVLGAQPSPYAALGRLPSVQPMSPLLGYQGSGDTIQPPPLAPATSTHAARPTTTQSTRPKPAIVPPGATPVQKSSDAPQHAMRRVRRIRVVRPTTPPKIVRPESIPAPAEVEEIHRPRSRHILAWTVAATLMLSACTIGGYAIWYYKAGPGLTSPIKHIFDDAMIAYEKKDYEAARKGFEEAAGFDVTAQKFVRIRDEANDWLLIADARIALTHDNFEETMRHIREAEKRGVGTTEVSRIKREYWAKKDAYRLEMATNDALERGQIAEAEIAHKAFEERAAAAGLDTESLKARIEMSKEDKRYSDAIQRAREAIIRGEFEAASLACTDAQRIHDNPETTKLAKEIRDKKLQARYVLQGDDAMLNRDYATAVEAYEAANKLGPTRETDNKCRQAQAYHLIETAQAKIDAGDLLAAQQDLKSSSWKMPTPSAAAKLKKYAPAFAAAARAQKADRQVEDGKYEKAIANYEKALADLPPPADALVENKLRDARGAWAVIQGDEAYKEGNWELALKRYQEAKTLGRNGDLEWKIQATQKKLAQTTTTAPTTP